MRIVGLGSAITCRRAVVCSVTALGCLLGLPAVASADPAPGSTETLTLSASYERELGTQMSITVEGAADGLHRLFVYGEAEGTCTPWPYEESTQKKAVWLSSPDGEPLAAGPFSKTYEVIPETSPSYDVCAYLDTTASGLPDDFESGCFWIPDGDCYFPSVSPAEILSSEEEARKFLEEADAERARRAAAEQAQRRTNEEAVARRASEEAQRRRATEEAERRAREAKSKRCRVPQLRRHTLAGVRHLLRDANCRLGRVTTLHRGHGTLIVKSQNPQHDKTLPQGSAVSIVLAVRAG